MHVVPDRVPGESSPGGLRVLVVDDDADTCQSMAMLLQMEGQEAHVAFDGPGAIRQVADLNPDLMCSMSPCRV